MVKRYDVVIGCSKEGIYEEECDTGEYVRYTDHAAEVARLEREMESAYRDASRLTTRLLEQESKTRAVMRERDEALAKLEDAKIANTVHIADADLYREAEVAKHEAKIAIEERDAALAEVARMRPVVEAAVRWLSDLTEYAELELERAARDYRDREAKDADNA